MRTGYQDSIPDPKTFRIVLVVAAMVAAAFPRPAVVVEEPAQHLTGNEVS